MRVPVKRYLDNKVTIMNDSDANGSKIKKIACIYNVAESHKSTLRCAFFVICEKCGVFVPCVLNAEGNDSFVQV